MKKFLNYTKKEALEAVKQSTGYALRYVKDQTETICLEAVKQNGDALRYVEQYYPSAAELVSDEDYLSLAEPEDTITVNGVVYIKKN